MQLNIAWYQINPKSQMLMTHCIHMYSLCASIHYTSQNNIWVVTHSSIKSMESWTSFRKWIHLKRILKNKYYHRIFSSENCRGPWSWHGSWFHVWDIWWHFSKPLPFTSVLGSNPKENDKGFYMFPCLKQDLKAFIVGQLHRRPSYLESRVPIWSQQSINQCIVDFENKQHSIN